MLWHRRFGHVGMDATRAALTKNYATGIKLDGSFIRDHCISCIVGKSPQKSYPYHGNRALHVGDLLHMDLCGPFPLQAPHGEKYFFNILDDKSNWGFTFGLRLKSDAFSKYLATEAFLARSKDVTIKTIRCGGELELTAGKMGDHLVSKGIVVQRTVPYAHQQNGKSERYIRTIEEGGQALLADSVLLMSFWLDAVLTRQYLVNCLPTSTLPADITPFEIINGRKPDLSHLCVWGCDCYVAVPDELRAKSGFKRFKAIFVGYEEHRIGWHVRDLHGKYSFRMMLYLMNTIRVVWVSLVIYRLPLLLLFLLLTHHALFEMCLVFARQWGRPLTRSFVLRNFDVLLGNKNAYLRLTLRLVLGVTVTWSPLALWACLVSMGVLLHCIQARILIYRLPFTSSMLSIL